MILPVYLEFAQLSEWNFEVGRQSRVGALEITTIPSRRSPKVLQFTIPADFCEQKAVQ